jgi:ubiquinone/menaquinone biosynthesis C-methylase UbiE
MNTDSKATLPTQRRGSWYQRLFASMMAFGSDANQQFYNQYKRRLFSDLHGDVLEIGPGTGPNLPYYAHAVRWQGLEPNPAMFPYIRQEAQRLDISAQVHEGHAEHIDAADDSFDAVVCTLVLCSVADPQRTIQEIKRVLKPGGQFVFIEHVAAPATSNLRYLQHMIKPIWKPLSDGCHPDRETWATIQNAGFASVQLDHFRVKVPIVAPHIAGVAIK